MASGENRRATQYFRDTLELTFEASDKTNAAYSLQGLTTVAEAQGEPYHAARLLGAAEALLEAVGLQNLYAQMDHEVHQRVVAAVRERLGERVWEEARREGRAMSFEEAVTYVLQRDEAPPTTP